MVHRQYSIGMVEIARCKQGVSWKGADQVEALLSEPVESGFYDLDFFTPQVAVFTGVGIQSTDQDARLLTAKALL